MNNRILFVEDDQDIRQLISAFLEKLEYEVIQFSDGTSLLTALETDENICLNADLIITDIMLPEISGIELISKLYERNLLTNIPIIFCTGLNDETIIQKAYTTTLKSLLFDYVVKPVNVYLLHLKIKNFINLKSNYNKLLTANTEITRLNLELEKLIDDKEAVNEYLKERLVKIIQHKKDNEFTDNIHIFKKMITSIATNDLPLIKFVEMVIESSKSVIYEMFVDSSNEAEEMFKVLPQAVEPLKTAIVDIELFINLLANLKIIDIKDLENSNLQKTSFYEIVYSMYRDGDFSEELFNKIINYAKFDVNKDSGNVELF